MSDCENNIDVDEAQGIDYQLSEPEEVWNKYYSQYSHMFKARNSKFSQNERRKALLKSVKDRRSASIDEKRGISEIFENINEINEDSEEEPMEVIPHQYNKKKKRKYANKLMLSEYLIEHPDDLEHNWMFKFCPIGVRNLVVAHGGTTKAYNKEGVLQVEFDSLLPGGSLYTNTSKFTLLDCIYNPDLRSYCVLDILAWNSFSLANCSTEFRFFFLRSKLEETPELCQKSRQNKFRFFEIPATPAQLSIIETMLSRPLRSETREHLDGILFYHSELDYRAGVTPLVGWIKPYMVPEILGIPVHECFMLDKPKNYTCLKDHIEKWTSQYKSSKRKRHYNKGKKKVVYNDIEMSEDFVDDLEILTGVK